MKLTTLKNGWTVKIEDVDLNNLTDEEVNIIGCLVGTRAVVVIKNQEHLTVEQEVKFLKRFGTPAADNPNVKSVVIDNSERILRRVSGQKDKDGVHIGMFPLTKELHWHADAIEDPDRKPVLYLRGVSGVKGSITNFTNHSIVWNSLNPIFKTKLEQMNLQVLHEHDQTGRWDQTMLDLYGTTVRKSMYKSEADLPYLIHKNQFGTEGLFLSFLQFGKFVGMSIEDSKTLLEKLKYTITHTKNVRYKHEWEDGDVVLADQWLGIHKRNEFEHIEKRMLHRATLDYSNIDVSFKETALNLLEV